MAYFKLGQQSHDNSVIKDCEGKKIGRSLSANRLRNSSQLGLSFSFIDKSISSRQRMSSTKNGWTRSQHRSCATDQSSLFGVHST